MRKIGRSGGKEKKGKRGKDDWQIIQPIRWYILLPAILLAVAGVLMEFVSFEFTARDVIAAGLLGAGIGILAEEMATASERRASHNRHAELLREVEWLRSLAASQVQPRAIQWFQIGTKFLRALLPEYPENRRYCEIEAAKLNLGETMRQAIQRARFNENGVLLNADECMMFVKASIIEPVWAMAFNAAFGLHYLLVRAGQEWHEASGNLTQKWGEHTPKMIENLRELLRAVLEKLGADRSVTDAIDERLKELSAGNPGQPPVSFFAVLVSNIAINLDTNFEEYSRWLTEATQFLHAIPFSTRDYCKQADDLIRRLENTPRLR